MPLPPSAEAALRARARVRSSHFSTFIEGNRLTLEEAKAVINDEKAEIEGRERDVSEVRNYWNALLRVEEWTRKKKALTEDLIKRLHALVESGPRARPTPYREGQNAIRNSMAALVQWATEAEDAKLPAPLVAGLVHLVAQGGPILQGGEELGTPRESIYAHKSTH